MPTILKKESISTNIKVFELLHPALAAKAQPGQFVILRVTDKGERIPLTIADYDREAGTITIAVQTIGATTQLLAKKNVGDSVAGIVGPLGTPTHLERYGTVVCIGGGIGIACIHTIARGFRDAGNDVISIVGSRNKEVLIFEERMRAASSELIITTDDGSAGEKGFVTDRLRALVDAGRTINHVFAVGPAPMMAAVADMTRGYGIRTSVSLNPIMVDGTGMCGGCRVTVDGKTRFACVDGPDFDAHLVDFKELLQRQGAYKREEECHLMHHRELGDL